MIKNKSLQNYTSLQLRTPQVFKFKSLIPKSTQIPLNKNKTQEKTHTFSHNSNYPFRNQIKNEFRLYKTVINIPISQEQLKNVVSISHANMIKIQKIAKGSGKNAQGKQAQIYYSIYYEVIPYSLNEVATSFRKYQVLLPNLTTLLLCQQLLSVMQYLIKENINYQLQMEDIGITEPGNIKVYISPLLLINPNSQAVNRKKAIDSIDTVIQWWKTTTSKAKNNQIQNDSQQYSNLLFDAKQLEQSPIHQIRTSSASFIQKQTQDDEPTELSIEGNIMHKSQVQENRKNHLNYERMKKLDRQIKNIRETLKQKVKIKERKEREDNTPKTSKEKEIQKTKMQFIQRFKKETKIDQPKVQSIQQNIHCINIFHNTVPIDIDKIANMHNNSQVLQTNNKIIIQRGKKQVREVAKPNIAVTYHNQIPDDLYHQEEDNLSIDTYDMDIGLDFQISGNSKNKILFTNRQREKSQCNYKAKKEQSNKTKAGSNQVMNKNLTASAGPKQFKNFVVNFVKPQFMAKRSNIYEDPGEQQSQNSKSVSKKFSVNYKQLNEAGKSVTSGTQKSGSLVKQTPHQLQNKMITDTQPPKNNQNSNTKYMKKASIINTENTEIIPQDKLMKQQRSETIIGSKKLQDLQIGKKVIEALQKTKKAIAIMNRVRMSSKKVIS